MKAGVIENIKADDKIISDSTYNFVIGITLFWGFAINWLMVLKIPVESISGINTIAFCIGYILSCFLGCYIYYKSNNPVLSFVGYNFVVVPLGLVINLAVSKHNPDIVLEAIRLTGMITFFMMLLGSMFPAFFKKISSGLAIALLCVFVVLLIEIFIFNTHVGFLNWLIAIIFCGYIGFDWVTANAVPKTYDNAVDSAAELYIDIISLFINLLEILDSLQIDDN